MKIYEIVTLEDSEILKATTDGRELWIPLDPANSDYAEYLRYTAWVEAGNEPAEFWANGGI
jgi:hypothetical protein